MNRFLSCGVLLFALTACSTSSKTSTSETGGNTSWLSMCDQDDDCSSGVCYNGACTSECSSPSDCGDWAADAECSSSRELSGCEQPSGSVCLPSCDGDDDCADYGSGVECAGGVCQPTKQRCASSGDDDPDADDVVADNSSDDASNGNDDATDDANSTDGSVTDEGVTDDTPPAEADDAPSDEAPSDDAPSDDALSDDALSDDALSDDALSDDALSDDALSDDASAEDSGDEAVADEPSTDDVSTDDVSTDDATADDPSDSGVGDESDDPADAAADDEAAVADAGSQSGSGTDGGGMTTDPEAGNGDPAGLRVPECPSVFERCDSDRCLDGELCVTCPPGQVCVEVELSCGPAGGSTAQCVEDPCAGGALDCSCAGVLCDELNLSLACGVYAQDHFLVGPDRDPFLSCIGGGVCASPHTRIATPSGDVRIDSLSAGDLVYSQERNEIRAVPLLKVSRTPVSHHQVVQLTLSDGQILEISGPHPTADGRRMDELEPGDLMDGLSVVERRYIPYTYAYTYDILPDSSTGTYVAQGVWMGSTLR